MTVGTSYHARESQVTKQQHEKSAPIYIDYHINQECTQKRVDIWMKRITRELIISSCIEHNHECDHDVNQANWLID